MNNTISHTKNKRIESLDWLRGLTAVSIMIYHLKYWIFPDSHGDSFINRMGIYGVGIFFALSGLSMAIVYKNKLNNKKYIIDFILKRIFRILPLLTIVTLLSIIPNILNGSFKGWKLLLINITGLFGFISPNSYIAVGAWSIGNELVYYALTPFILYIYDKKIKYGNTIFIFSLFIGFIFSTFLLKNNLPINQQWHLYINPFNNLFLYISGIYIIYNLNIIKLSQIQVLITLILLVVCFTIIPINGNYASEIITNFYRWIFIFISIGIVFISYKMEIILPKKITFILENFGIATYGIYLFHPIVYKYFKLFNLDILIENNYLFMFIIMVITVILAIISYHFFEMKISNYGKKMINRYLHKKFNV